MYDKNVLINFICCIVINIYKVNHQLSCSTKIILIWKYNMLFNIVKIELKKKSKQATICTAIKYK